MLQNIVDFKAKSFLTEQNTSTMAYEVKAVRALWDPSLSIPGTNRRGGWRCPVGTRYGGQITDRFGRSCGWGVARRIANQISDIGQRLESVDDARRGRRIARRERRILARLNPDGAGAGRIEQGLRGVAERLDGGDAPNPRGARRRTVVARPPSVDAPDTPRVLAPARNDRNLLAAEPLNVLEEMRDELENATGGRDSDDYKRVMAELKRRNAVARPARRRRAPNLRESEQRRMDREIDQPGAPRTGEAPARPARNRGNLLAAEPLNVLEEMRDELENTTDGRDSDDYKRVMAELKRRNAPARPARRRQEARPRGDGNLRESEQRRMDREIAQPGAPRTGEAPARRRRRAVVETSKTPKAPTQQEAKPKPQVEPKVVKPRRPKKNPEGDIGAMLDAESEQRRVPKPAPRKGVDVGQVPQGFRKTGDGRWESRDWRVQQNVDRDGNPVGLTAQSQLRPREVVSGKDWDELVAKINRAERIHAELQRGDNDNAARSEEMRQNREAAALAAIADAQKRQRASGWTRGPGTIMTHQNGDIIDKTIGGKWFVVYGRPGETKTGFDNPEEAIAWHKENVLKSAADRAAIDAPFLTPKAVQNASVPKALKFEQQVADVAKFSTENQAVVEQALLEFKDPKNLANFVLAADAHIFNENEGRQGAIRDFNDLILREVEKYEQNPQQYGDLKTKLEEIQRTYYRLLNRNLGTKAEIENKLLQLKSAQRRYWGFLANPTGDNDALKESVRLQAMLQLSEAQGQIGQFEQGMKLVEKLEAEIGKGIQRKEQGMFFNPDAANVVKPLDEDVAKKIKSQIDVAIERRQGKLAKYLKKRDPNNTAKYVDMTKEKFDALTNNEKIAYLEEAYGHPRIEGANGKLYSATARVSGFNRTFSASVTFHEIDKDGNKLRQVGTSERSISSAKVYNASMFIGSVLDRGADIQTIYNQHAFLYLKKMGITKAGVTAAQDGQYVWPRIGFKSPNPLRSLDLSPLQKELKFFEKFGAGGLVSSEAEYMRIKSILDQARRGKTFTHQEIIFAIDDPVGNKPRGEFVKQWFISNMRSSGGYLSFADQKIGKRFGGATRAPRRRNP